MISVKEISIVPTFKCNLNCDFCLYSELRVLQRNEILPLDRLATIFEILKKEESNLKRVAIFGGEVLLLDRDYLRELFLLTRSYFPGVAFGIVTNLIEVPPWFENLVKEFSVYVSTSYEGLRFSSDSFLYSTWKKNLDYVRRFTEPGVNFVLTRDDRAFENACKTIVDNEFKYVHLVNFTIPDYFPEEKKRHLIEKYALTPSSYYKKFAKAVKCFFSYGILARSAVPISYTSVETLEIRPDGSVIIVSPSPEGFPFEKEVVIDYERSGSIVFSEERMKVVSEWLSNYPCVSCRLPLEYCLMEVRYPGVCPGIPDEETLRALSSSSEAKANICRK